MTSASKEKQRPSNFFQFREHVVVRRDQIRRIGWVNKKMEAQVGQFLPGCKCPVSQGIVVQEQEPLGEIPAAFFPQNVLQLHQQRCVILRADSLALWKIIIMMDAVLIPKSRGRREFFQRIFALGIFWGGVSRYAATPLIVALSPGHSDITKFRPWLPIATGNHFDRAQPKKFQNLLRRLAPLTFFFRVHSFRDPLSEEFPHVQILMNDGPNPLT